MIFLRRSLFLSDFLAFDTGWIFDNTKAISSSVCCTCGVGMGSPPRLGRDRFRRMRQIDEVNFTQHFWNPEEKNKTNDVWGKDVTKRRVAE